MREWRRRRTIICAQPGGNGNLKDAFEKELNEYAIAVREFGFRCKKFGFLAKSLQTITIQKFNHFHSGENDT